jgi:hypothetical protein
MTQIDEKALEAATVETAFAVFDDAENKKIARVTITAYLAALPPTGDVGKPRSPVSLLQYIIDEQTGDHPRRIGVDTLRETIAYVQRTADALTAQAARIAELERERDEAYSKGLSAGATQFAKLHDRIDEANARAERLKAALREIKDLEGEINTSNYDHDDACELNRQFCYAVNIADTALSPAPATDIQLPKGWLARELDGVAADVAQMSPGIRESLEEVVAASARDWTEDFALDNGNYFSRCVKCKSRFLGHKRRAVCKACAIPIPSKGGDDE